MVGRHDAAEFATPEHFTAIEETINYLVSEWVFWDGDLPEYCHGMSPKLAEYTREYLNILKNIPNLPYFLIWNHSDACCFHWKRENIELITQLFCDGEGDEPNSVSYLEFDMSDKDRPMILQEVAPEDFYFIVDRLNNPLYTYN